MGNIENDILSVSNVDYPKNIKQSIEFIGNDLPMSDNSEPKSISI